MEQKHLNKVAITKSLEALSSIRAYLIERNGITKDEAKEITKHFYKTFKKGFVAGAEWADNEMKERRNNQH